VSAFHIHLVSDATGETLVSVFKAVLAQYSDVDATQHLWTMVRNQQSVDQVMTAVADKPGMVMFTFVDRILGGYLKDRCVALGVPCIGVLDPILDAFTRFFGGTMRAKPGLQHEMNEEYFQRIDAIHYCMSHDDGQNAATLYDADVVLVGVSRTSKTPTCIYLANRGVKAANVPIVPGIPLPEELDRIKKPLIVGLITSPERLVQVRRNRLLSLKQAPETDYVDNQTVREEVTFARKHFSRNAWPVIDVTRRSIEETAAAVINLMSK
jgi:regulator of PEP synthase PpsR (kinase-PPPase family)